MRAQLVELIDEKLELIERTKEQMAPDVEAGVLIEGTEELLSRAHLMFTTAKEKLAMHSVKTDSEALFMFGRGNWNMGEFQSNVKYSKRSSALQGE